MPTMYNSLCGPLLNPEMPGGEQVESLIILL